jgi:hypothetical protein
MIATEDWTGCVEMGESAVDVLIEALSYECDDGDGYGLEVREAHGVLLNSDVCTRFSILPTWKDFSMMNRRPLSAGRHPLPRDTGGWFQLKKEGQERK